MNSTLKRTLVIILIIAISIGVGFAADALWSFLERKTHPTNYEEIIDRYSKEYNVPKAVIFAVVKTESDFDPNAESSAGAIGLMQMMPSTFEWLTGEEHLGEELPTSKLTDPEVSIRYGTYYLAYLRSKFTPAPTEGDTEAIASATNWDTIFAAYNAGEGNVAKWLKDPEYADGNGGLKSIPFSETRSYVSKVNSALEMYEKLYPTEAGVS